MSSIMPISLGFHPSHCRVSVLEAGPSMPKDATRVTAPQASNQASEKKGAAGGGALLLDFTLPAQGHAVMRLATFTVPMPVAKSQPVAVP
jgi:hypothetical protein